MWKACAIACFGLGPILAAATGAEAAGKTINMGYIDQATITRACQHAGTVPFASGADYGCRTRRGSIVCNGLTCVATGSDLSAMTGNSLENVMEGIDQRAGRRILPLETRVEPLNQRAD